MEKEGLVYVLLVGGFIWSLWLATCRPDAYNKLSDGMMDRAGRMGRGVLKIFGLGARSYLRHRRGW